MSAGDMQSAYMRACMTCCGMEAYMVDLHADDEASAACCQCMISRPLTVSSPPWACLLMTVLLLGRQKRALIRSEHLQDWLGDC